MLAGAQLALAGALTQSVLRNPLAEPATLGVTGGACLAAVALVILGDRFAIDGRILFALQPFAALSGGVAAAVLVIRLGWRRGAAPRRLVLCGIVVASTAQLVVVGLLAGWGQGRIEGMLVWIAGGLYGADWRHVSVLAVSAGLAGLTLPFLLRPAALLALGDAHAASLSVNVGGWRLVLLFFVVFVTAISVAMVGPVGFLGLVVPHIARSLAGSRPVPAVLVAPMVGALLAVVTDTIGRIAFAPNEMPLGALSALVGVPFLLLQIRRMTA